MSDAITADYCLPVRAPTHAPRAAVHPFPARATERQVREDKGYYIPDFLEHFEAEPELRDAADEHAKDLRRAQRALDEVLNLVRLLKASLGDEGDSRAMQAETVLNVIDKKLNKAQNRIDRHATRHRNLFLAYFELRDNPTP
jgi:hypothetical protein